MLHWLTLLAYVIHLLCQLRQSAYGIRLYTIASLALVLHALTLAYPLIGDDGFGFFTVLSLAGLGSVLSVLVLQLMGWSCAFLQLWFVPIACFTILADVFFTNTYVITITNAFGLAVHVFLSIAALSLVSISSVMLFYGAVQDYQLKRPQTKQWQMPAMETIKNLSRIFLLIAWMALTLSVVSGLVFIDDFLKSYLAHKTVFTLVAWLLLTLLIFVFRRHTLRWKRSFLLCTSVTIFLFAGYFGSRFVVEFILS